MVGSFSAFLYWFVSFVPQTKSHLSAPLGEALREEEPYITVAGCGILFNAALRML